MFLEIILFLAAGILAGTIMGLIPGIHPNMIIIMTPLFLLWGLNAIIFIMAMAVSNTIINFVPAIFIGASDSGGEMTNLPGHRMLLCGQGYKALLLIFSGCIGSIILLLVSMPAILLTLPVLHSFLYPYIFAFLIAFSLWMVLAEKKKILFIIFFVMAGIIGLIGFKLNINSNLILFPILSGFFGLSLLLIQMRSPISVPAQNTHIKIKFRKSPVILGSLLGLISGFLPGVGTSEMSGLAARKDDESFLVAIGALSTAGIILSILSLWIIGNPRSGAALMIDQISKIGFKEFFAMLSTAVAAAGFSVAIALFFSKNFSSVVRKIDYKILNMSVIAFIILMSVIFCGVVGLILLFVSTMLGLSVHLSSVKRSCLMGVLIIPTIIFYLP